MTKKIDERSTMDRSNTTQRLKEDECLEILDLNEGCMRNNTIPQSRMKPNISGRCYCKDPSIANQRSNESSTARCKNHVKHELVSPKGDKKSLGNIRNVFNDESMHARDIVVSPPTPILSPETSYALENAERMVQDAQKQIAELNVLSRRVIPENGDRYPDESLPLENESEELLYIRELVAAKFHETDKRSCGSCKNNSDRSSNPKAKTIGRSVDLSESKFQMPERAYPSYSRGVGYQRRDKSTDKIESKDLSVDRFLTYCSSADKIVGHTDESFPKKSKEMPNPSTLRIQVGPPVHIERELISQNLENIHISPDPSFVRHSSNIGTYEFCHADCKRREQELDKTNDEKNSMRTVKTIINKEEKKSEVEVELQEPTVEEKKCDKSTDDEIREENYKSFNEGELVNERKEEKRESISKDTNQQLKSIDFESIADVSNASFPDTVNSVTKFVNNQGNFKKESLTSNEHNKVTQSTLEIVQSVKIINQLTNSPKRTEVFEFNEKMVEMCQSQINPDAVNKKENTVERSEKDMHSIEKNNVFQDNILTKEPDKLEKRIIETVDLRTNDNVIANFKKFDDPDDVRNSKQEVEPCKRLGMIDRRLKSIFIKYNTRYKNTHTFNTQSNRNNAHHTCDESLEFMNSRKANSTFDLQLHRPSFEDFDPVLHTYSKMIGHIARATRQIEETLLQPEFQKYNNSKVTVVSRDCEFTSDNIHNKRFNFAERYVESTDKTLVTADSSSSTDEKINPLASRKSKEDIHVIKEDNMYSNYLMNEELDLMQKYRALYASRNDTENDVNSRKGERYNIHSKKISKATGTSKSHSSIRKSYSSVFSPDRASNVTSVSTVSTKADEEAKDATDKEKLKNTLVDDPISDKYIDLKPCVNIVPIQDEKGGKESEKFDSDFDALFNFMDSDAFQQILQSMKNSSDDTSQFAANISLNKKHIIENKITNALSEKRINMKTIQKFLQILQKIIINVDMQDIKSLITLRESLKHSINQKDNIKCDNTSNRKEETNSNVERNNPENNSPITIENMENGQSEGKTKNISNLTNENSESVCDFNSKETANEKKSKDLIRKHSTDILEGQLLKESKSKVDSQERSTKDDGWQERTINSDMESLEQVSNSGDISERINNVYSQHIDVVKSHSMELQNNVNIRHLRVSVENTNINYDRHVILQTAQAGIESKADTETRLKPNEKIKKDEKLFLAADPEIDKSKETVNEKQPFNEVLEKKTEVLNTLDKFVRNKVISLNEEVPSLHGSKQSPSAANSQRDSISLQTSSCTKSQRPSLNETDVRNAGSLRVADRSVKNNGLRQEDQSHQFVNEIRSPKENTNKELSSTRTTEDITPNKLFTKTYRDQSPKHVNCIKSTENRLTNQNNSESDTSLSKSLRSSGTSYSEGEVYVPSSSSYSLGEVRIVRRNNIDIDNASNYDVNGTIFTIKNILTFEDEFVDRSLGEI